MSKYYTLFFCIGVIFMACNKTTVKQKSTSLYDVEHYVTSFDQAYKLSSIEPTTPPITSKASSLIIDSSIEYQTMDGFGFSLTGGSAQHLLSLSEEQRLSLLQELFGSDDNSIAVSYLRISIGSSDLDERAFSYNDIDPSSQDFELNKFTLQEDEEDLIPILKEILVINPEIKIMASPWSPPAWMKTNKSSKGGSLKHEYYNVYANYFVKYINSMAEHGIIIDAITVQNEPLHPGNNPSLYMTPEDQAQFVKESLGPTFDAENITAKIVIYDHNADRVDYPMTVLNDSEANKYIEGTAFHLYGGEIGNLKELHNVHPDKSIYFTEQWIGSPGNFETDFPWHINNLIIGASRNWCKTVLEWNLSSDPELEPHTPGGCTECLGAITIDGDIITRNPAYYIIAQASKFVMPGSKRIFSTEIGELPNVAFSTPEDEIVLILLNEENNSKSINLEIDGVQFKYAIEPESAATYIFQR